MSRAVSKTLMCLALALVAVLCGALITQVSGLPHQALKITPEKNLLGYLNSVKPQKIIIDVDAGGDDAEAILLALLHQRKFDTPNVIAITCTHGNVNVDQVVINVLKTLKIANINIPVYKGANSSLIITPRGDSFFGKDGFGEIGDVGKLGPVEKEHAVIALTRLVRENPGEITLIALGPLTNVALATRLDPTFRGNLKALYWMGGSIQGVGNIQPGIEFNAYIDPAANFIVFNATGCPPVIMIPWETCTIQAAVSKDWRENVLGKINSPYVKFLNAIQRIALSKSKNTWAACDPQAMAVLLEPSIIKNASYHHVKAVTEGDITRGAFMIDYRDTTNLPKNAILIQAIDVEKYKEITIDLLSTSSK